MCTEGGRCTWEHINTFLRKLKNPVMTGKTRTHSVWTPLSHVQCPSCAPARP